MTYFEWLEKQVVYFDKQYTYHNLLSVLYSVEYIPRIDKDQNRLIDGIYIRKEYFDKYRTDQSIVSLPCNFLEFLIGLARRMNYIYGDVYEDRTKDCFWTLIRNMGLSELNDLSYEKHNEHDILFAVYRVINRTYDVTGDGGLFPLQNPRENQRNVEVWYQMNQYLAEAMSEEGRL